jgi:hypothetical protein
VRFPAGSGAFSFAVLVSNSMVVVEAYPVFWDGGRNLQAVVLGCISFV